MPAVHAPLVAPDLFRRRLSATRFEDPGRASADVPWGRFKLPKDRFKDRPCLRGVEIGAPRWRTRSPSSRAANAREHAQAEAELMSLHFIPKQTKPRAVFDLCPGERLRHVRRQMGFDEIGCA
jgi:hypothetical protein